MLIPSSRILLAAALLLPLAACTGGPQQPSDVVDDQGTAATSGTASSPTVANPAPGAVTKLETSALATGGSNASIESLIGGWADNAESCKAPGPSVTLTASRLETMEQSCEISDVIDGGQGSLTLGLSCGASDGAVDAQLVKLSPTATGIDMTVVGGDSGPQSLVRCP